VNGILDGEFMEVELARNRVELLRVGLDNAQPDERVVAFAGVARPVERESPRLALPSLVDGAVDDHGPSMGRLVRGMETVSGRACRLHALLRLPLPPGDWLVSEAGRRSEGQRTGLKQALAALSAGVSSPDWWDAVGRHPRRRRCRDVIDRLDRALTDGVVGDA
jgi:hypothetical protein